MKRKHLLTCLSAFKIKCIAIFVINTPNSSAYIITRIGKLTPVATLSILMMLSRIYLTDPYSFLDRCRRWHSVNTPVAVKKPINGHCYLDKKNPFFGLVSEKRISIISMKIYCHIYRFFRKVYSTSTWAHSNRS